MRVRIFTEPQQGSTYEQLLAVARCAEDEGFDGFFRSDHYLKLGDGSGLPGPTDAWTTLAGLARDTFRLRLGTLVSPATFRLPGPLAVTVAQVDAMSGGRVELGLGTGWFEAEHLAYGIPFPPLKERFERLEEQLAVISGMWTTPLGETFTHHGHHYRLEASPALPKPVQRPHPPIIVGGGGEHRTPHLAATYADEFNSMFIPPAELRARIQRIQRACEAVGRDPDSMRYSVTVVMCCGVDDVEIARRAKAIGRDVDELRSNGACGTPPEVANRLNEWAEAGAQTMYLQILDLADLEHLRLIVLEVLPALPD